MAIELPGEVVSFPQFIGVNWPPVTEDKVREFASHVREFGQNVEAVQDEATTTVRQLGQAYESASYEALPAKWARSSDSHITEPAQADRGLDHLTDDVPLQEVGQHLGRLLDQHHCGLRRTERGRFQAAESALGVSGGGSAGTGFRIGPAAPEAHAEVMHGHAETVAGHAQTCQAGLAGVSFE